MGGLEKQSLLSLRQGRKANSLPLTPQELHFSLPTPELPEYKKLSHVDPFPHRTEGHRRPERAQLSQDRQLAGGRRGRSAGEEARGLPGIGPSDAKPGLTELSASGTRSVLGSPKGIEGVRVPLF